MLRLENLCQFLILVIHIYANACLCLEVTVSNKKGYVITSYRSLGKKSDEFDSFISNLEKL